MENFRAYAKNIRYFERSQLLDKGPAQEQIDTLMARYLAGETQLDGFLQALTETARLVHQESR